MKGDAMNFGQITLGTIIDIFMRYFDEAYDDEEVDRPVTQALFLTWHYFSEQESPRK